MQHQNRRTFLKHTAAASLGATTFTIAGTKASGRVLGANDRVRVAVAGINGRGRQVADSFCRAKGVELAYLVDPDSRLFATKGKGIQKKAGYPIDCVQDVRQALDDKNLDVVAVVTPNHWHALMGIWACQAGKDVYVEKPCSHNISEGRKLVDAARKYNRIVQHGTQRRANSGYRQLIENIRNGKYGKLQACYARVYRTRSSIGVKDDRRPPREVDFNTWLGPAPAQPFHKNLLHYQWHWQWDFGNGEIGNIGAHQIDLCRWALPDDATPRSVVSLGGRFSYTDQGQTPNTHLAMVDFGEAKIFIETRGLVKKPWEIHCTFHTDQGVVRVQNGKFFPKGDRQGVPIENAPPPGLAVQGVEHVQNFVNAVRSRRREDLYAEIEHGHRSAMLAHLGNISYRLGKDVSFDQATKASTIDAMLGESFERMKRHLSDVGGLDLTRSTCRLGRTLQFNGKTEKFIAAPEADQLLTRPYRVPFVVPEEV